jgi:hypothetical protein
MDRAPVDVKTDPVCDHAAGVLQDFLSNYVAGYEGG